MPYFLKAWTRLQFFTYYKREFVFIFRKTSLDNNTNEVQTNETEEEEPTEESSELASSSFKSHTSLSRQASGGADKGSAGSHNSSSHSIIRRESFAEEENKFRLDADYIQRYLGELSPMEESQLVQLRNWLAQLQKGNVMAKLGFATTLLIRTSICGIMTNVASISFNFLAAQ